MESQIRVMKTKYCPKCGSLDVDYDYSLKEFRCMWIRCGWCGKKALDKHPFPEKFKKFRDSITKKTRM